jgi:hypothetical protein
MKSKNAARLALKKATLSHLSKNQLQTLKGGAGPTKLKSHCIVCPVTTFLVTCTP